MNHCRGHWRHHWVPYAGWGHPSGRSVLMTSSGAEESCTTPDDQTHRIVLPVGLL